MIELRPYQHAGVEALREAYRSGKRAPLYQAPCGAGKTRLFAYVASNAAARGQRVLLLAHRTELVDQISQALSDENCDHGYIAAGYPYIANQAVYVASVFTVAKRLESFNPDLIVIDEAHHTVARSWRTVIDAYPNAKRLGVTATPCRLSGQGLDDLFDTLIQGPSYEQLISEGYLTPVRVYAPPTIDCGGMRSRAGDFATSDIVDRADRVQITGDAIEHYRRHTAGARAIVFDVSVEAARKRAQAFRDAGFTAECIFGETAREVRSLAIADFRAGRIQVLVSVELVSEGFDLPAVEVGIGLRPTQSLGLYLQQAGRVLRPFPGKAAAVFFDHAGNTLRHGLPTEERTWCLAGLDPLLKRAERRSSLRTCPSCFAVSQQGAVVCRACGHTFKVEPREVRQVQGELEEITRESLAQSLIRARLKGEQGQARTLEQLTALGRQRGYRHPQRWAYAVIKGREKKRHIS